MDRGTLRSAGFVALLVVVFLTVNTSVAAAADHAASAGGGLLAPLNVTTSEGAPLSGYELRADGGDITDVTSQFQTLILGGLFSLVRLLVGLACWLIGVAFQFPLLTAMLRPAQAVSDAYTTHVVGAIGLKGVLLSWAFVFGLILVARGKVGRGLGEILLTLVIAALAASAFVRPDYLLAKDGPLDQTHQAAVELAAITSNSYFGNTPTSGPGNPACDRADRPAPASCASPTVGGGDDVAKSVQDALTNALVVKPFQLLQYGRLLDDGKPENKAAYAAHLTMVKGAGEAEKNETSPCDTIPGPAKDYCDGTATSPLDQGPSDPQFAALLDDLDNAGDVGKQAADYARAPSWDRIGGVLLLGVAAVVVTAMATSLALILLGTQAADVAAAAAGAVTFIWGMLPGPSRMAVWRWIGTFLASVMVMFTTAMTIPMFGIGIDALLTSTDSHSMIERLLLLDAFAIAALVFHRRLQAATAQFGQRLAMRMRYSKVGGTHLPGDSSELGAAIGAHMSNNGGSGLRLGTGGGLSGAHGALLLRQRFLSNALALTDTTGTPMDGSRMTADFVAEARRGLAPIGMAVTAATLGARGAYATLVGRRPDDEALQRMRRPVGPGERDGEGNMIQPGEAPVVNRHTGELFHDPDKDRTLLSTRVHNRAVRFRGYRIARRGALIAHGATLGLPRSVSEGRRHATDFTRDAMHQLQATRGRVGESIDDWAAVKRDVQRGTAHVGQRLATAIDVHDPATQARAFVRDAAVGGWLLGAGSEGRVADPRDRRPTASHPDHGPGADRRRVFDALMEAQRTDWQWDRDHGGES
ncbi:hypothetical protein [Streptomyces sp. MI02-7b]|uniref:hypothetical protein n=1 Tax=Streptomyces sp. MI02-7b TaxID=462941 RepID=UPI0029A7D3A2|nr:hypothetical protein [Streptomyces sp. MI02-7b]MDX3075900.1 hypothetical protein [Streptomyces sp. MI02-7b]